MNGTGNWASRVIQSFAFAALLVVSVVAQSAFAANVKFVGNVGYSYVGNTVVLTSDEVDNNDSGGISGTLKMELWALASPYGGSATTGYKLAEYTLGQLQGGFHFPSINSGSIPFSLPPNGTWYVAMILTEYTAGSVDGGYSVRDYVNFTKTLVVGSPPPPPPSASVSPQPGLWWNPIESGSGYSLDFHHGVLVVLIYSYQTNGAPQWYIASGPVSGYTFTSPLSKYGYGQCISCGYQGPSAIGSDGTVTIVFSSDTSATVYLPGGRVTQIVPDLF